MLICELCYSFRAVRLLHLILLQENSLKKNPFFLRCSVSGVWGFLYVSVALSCPARRQSSHYLPTEALPCWCEVRPVAAGSALLLRSLPCCHGLRPAAESLCCGRLPQQQQAVSAMDVYLIRGGLPRQWQTLLPHQAALSWVQLCPQ